MLNYPVKCPHCGCNLEGEDVYEEMLKKCQDPQEALEYAKMFGWSEDSKERFTRLLGVYNIETDRTEYFICPDCRERVKVKRRYRKGFRTSGTVVVRETSKDSPE